MNSLTTVDTNVDTATGTNVCGYVGVTECHFPQITPEASVDGLHRVKIMAESNPAFATALRSTNTTEAAALLAQAHGIVVSPEALWRQRGTLTEAGMPTWRG